MKKIVSLFCMLIIVQLTFGRSFRVNQIPNGSKFGCLTCHQAAGGPRNSFGLEIQGQFLNPVSSSGMVVWEVDLAQLDSDGDGATNGVELLDPDGEWRAGDTNPGETDNVTNPGDANSVINTNVPTKIISPSTWMLSQNYPNPFNNRTHFHYQLPEAGSVHFQIVNTNGRVIWEKTRYHSQAGLYHIEWNGLNQNGLDAESGIYVFVMRLKDQILHQKMLYLK